MTVSETYARKFKEEASFPSRSFQLNYVMNNVLDSAAVYAVKVKEYNCELYLKGHLKAHKRNRLFRFIPTMMKLEKGEDNYLYESISEYHYTAPDLFDRKIKAISSTSVSDENRVFDIVDYMDFNIYSLGIMHDKLLSPISWESIGYYKYKIDSVIVADKGEVYKVHITPRYPSTQLMEGNIWVSSSDWTIRYMEFSGRYDLIHFNISMKMGDDGNRRILPSFINLTLNFKFLKNHLEMIYTGWMKYDKVVLLNHDEMVLKRLHRREERKKRNRQCNLSNLYNLTCDTTELIVSPTEFNRIRPVPLDEEEDSLYAVAYSRRAMEQTDTLATGKRRGQRFWGQLGEKLVNSYNIDMNNVGHISFSPLLSPLLLSYSHNKGISYRQEFKYNKLFSNGKLLSITPKIGYNFTKKELYGMGDIRFVYNPERNAAIELSAGNGNRIYSSVILDQFRHNPDSMAYLDEMEMDYFKDINVNLSHNIEVLNGLNIWAGISAHWRYTRKTVDIDDQIRLSYNSFAPRLRVEWTPYMKYYMRGNRKINVGSAFPKFSLDYEKGIKLWKNCMRYDRFEMSMEQQIKFRNVKSLSYHIGGGFFSDKSEIFFVDFVDFSNNNLPQGWNDDIGGMFQLLGSKWYNSALHYFRTNFTYEAPFILLHPVNRLLSFIQKERIYGGILFMPHLCPYFEIGYGLGTHLFDVGVFVGNMNGKFNTVGFKFTFELFNN